MLAIPSIIRQFTTVEIVSLRGETSFPPRRGVRPSAEGKPCDRGGKYLQMGAL